MAVESPMSNFNRKNPFVIQAKGFYDQLMGLYHKIMKGTIIGGGITVIIGVILLVLAFPFSKWLAVYAVAHFIVAAIFMNYIIRHTIEGDDNDIIDDMVSMEINDIINVNNEFMYNLVYIENKLIGKAEFAIKMVSLGTILINSLSIIVAICLCVGGFI